MAGALCLEPLALTVAGGAFPRESTIVWTFEIIAGIGMAAYFLVAGIASRRCHSSLAVRN